MANENNALVLSDNDNGTQSATWTPIEEITPDQKVLIGNVDPRSGTIQATWNPSSEAAVFKDGTFTVNGIYDAQEDDCDGYKTVTVDVANSYEASDEGKVVSDGALVAQTARAESITTNGTYDTSINNSVTVDVPGVQFAASPSAFTLLKNIRNLNVEIPSGITSISSEAFYNCTGLTSIEIPSSVTSISSYAFNDCTGLTSIEIPSSLTSISDSAFNGCTGLTSIEIPSSVTSIGNSAFANCTNLTSIVVHKAEGSITGAPWGATNATVTWDG